MEKRSHKPLRNRPSRPAAPSNLVIGIHPVKELFRSDAVIERVLIQKELMNRQEGMDILYACRAQEIPYQPVPQEKLNRLTPKVHQGVVAFISPIPYQKIENLIPILFEEGKIPFVLVLDRVTDVRNFGAIARTCECAGVHALVVPEKGGAQINEDALKTSAGALNHLPVCRERDLGKTLNYLRDSGLTLVACTEKGDKTLFEVPMKGPVALILGSEEDGISEFLLRKVHYEARIPQVGKIGSLNVGVATAISLYEVVRQREFAHVTQDAE
jgi:23S rRNA (guanosine2251-2'-O)-methyltransferase